MTNTPKGGKLFIVDNSTEGWTGLRYLRDWTDLANSFDIADRGLRVRAIDHDPSELSLRWDNVFRLAEAAQKNTVRKNRGLGAITAHNVSVPLAAVNYRIWGAVSLNPSSEERFGFAAGTPLDCCLRQQNEIRESGI